MRVETWTLIIFALSETYDVILMAGAFAPSKLGPSSFPELLRILRPGGLILFVMEDGLITKVKQTFSLSNYVELILIFDPKGPRFRPLRRPHGGPDLRPQMGAPGK